MGSVFHWMLEGGLGLILKVGMKYLVILWMSLREGDDLGLGVMLVEEALVL